MPRNTRNTRKSNEKPAPEFVRVRDFIRRYSILPDEELDLAAVWAIGTHTFSPACQWPATYPYLYVTAPAGGGKTTFAQDAMGCVCRDHTSATGATGSTLFRMLGWFNEETGEVENLAPTLFLDEIDTTFSGSKDPDLQRAIDVGYKRGSTIPRASGKTYMSFPVYGPKLFAGIDNGHLPEPVLTRCIRIDLERKSQDELDAAGIEPFYIFDVEDEAAELQQELSDWAKSHSQVLREYRPKAPEGFTARQWEMGRSLVQLAHAMGIEQRIIESLITVLRRNPEKPDRKVTLYRSILSLFDETGEDRLTSLQILTRLTRDGVQVPGGSMKGLSAVLSEDGVTPDMVRLRPPRNGDPGHPAYDESKSPTQRGYFRHRFDGPFVRYLEDDE